MLFVLQELAAQLANAGGAAGPGPEACERQAYIYIYVCMYSTYVIHDICIMIYVL